MRKVSTLIPNYNNARWLPACLDSVLAQGDRVGEVIVVDDHSTDDSWAVLEGYQKQYPNVVRLFRNPAKGGNAARNHAFAQAGGAYIQWLDADDVLLPGKFAAQVAALEADPAVDIAYSGWRMDFYDEASGAFVRSQAQPARAYADYLEELLKDNWTSPNNYLLRRPIAEQLHTLPGWNPATRVAQDREYFTLAGLLGARFAYVPGMFAVYRRWSQQSVSGMDFGERLALTLDLEHAFRQRIRASERFTAEQKRRYVALLDTDALKACFYRPSLRLRAPIRPGGWVWSRIHPKMRPIIPLVWLYQHLKLRLR